MIYSLAIVADLGLYEQLLRLVSKLESAFVNELIFYFEEINIWLF